MHRLLWMLGEAVVGAAGLVGMVVGISGISTWLHFRRYRASGLELVDTQLDDEQFAGLIGEHYQRRGFRTEWPAEGAHPRRQFMAVKDGSSVWVLAQKSSDGISLETTQDLVKRAAREGAERAVIVTNGGLNRDAAEWGRSAGLEIWDRDRLMGHLAVRGGRVLALRRLASKGGLELGSH